MAKEISFFFRKYQSPHEEQQHLQYEVLDFSSFWVLDKLSFRIFLNICMCHVLCIQSFEVNKNGSNNDGNKQTGCYQLSKARAQSHNLKICFFATDLKNHLWSCRVAEVEVASQDATFQLLPSLQK